MRLLLIPLLLLLSSCQQPGPPGLPQALSFARYQPVFFDVATIEVVDEYQSPNLPPNIEHLMPYSPSEAMHIWVKDRLRAAGLHRSMQVIIKDGSVVAKNLPKPEGLQGLFTLSQDRQYDARLEVEMRIYEDNGAMSAASVQAVVTRSITTREDASVAERELALRKLTWQLMEAMNAQLEKNMFQYFGPYINFAHTP